MKSPGASKNENGIQLLTSSAHLLPQKTTMPGDQTQYLFSKVHRRFHKLEVKMATAAEMQTWTQRQAAS